MQIIDTKWKRTAPAISDSKRGVIQGDVYQMMAYGRLYGCGSLTLLYPHHGQLKDLPGIIGRHTITGTSDILDTVTIDVSHIGIAREGARAIADRVVAGR